MGDFKDGSNGGADDYMYDNNGNLIADLNKNITGIAGATGILYNHLDKPEQIKIAGKGIIKIVYDADGNKLERSYTPEGGVTKTTSYINQFVYESNTLQYIQMEEGRVRLLTPQAQNNGYETVGIDGALSMPDGKKGVWDYYIRDYQQNVRMVLTDETHFSSGTATMETGRAVIEEPVFGQTGGANELGQTRYAVTTIPGQQSGNGWNNGSIGNSVSRLSKLTNKVGPNSLLKVMAGDELSATTQYFYKSAVSNSSGTNQLATDVLSSLLQAISGGAATSGITKTSAANITGQLSGNIPFVNATNPQSGATDNIPKSYLSVLFFDERFNFVGEGSTSQRVAGADNSNAALTLANIKAPKNGYAYIYVSNESDEWVYFDNFKVGHTRGRIIEENHYYAYGLKIVGISSRKLDTGLEGSLKNEYGYNDKELCEEGELNWLDYGFRNYDAQIGRFLQIDPLADEYADLSPYLYAYNDPITNVDEDGLSGGNAVVQIFTGVGAQAAADAARMAGSNLAEVIVKASIKKAVSKSIGKIALNAANIAIDFIPIVGGARDVYDGVQSGSWIQAGIGIASIAADLFTFGTSSIAKGVARTAVREGAEVIAKETVEQVVKKGLTKGGTYVLKDGDLVVRTGRTKNLAQREIQHRLGKKTKDLAFEAVDHTDSHAAQRGLEHILSKKFEKSASKANGGLNKIKAMSDKTLKSAKGQDYLKAAEEHLKKIGQ